MSNLQGKSSNASSSKGSCKTAIPNFGKTTPFYIKATVAAAHIFSTCMVLAPHTKASLWAFAFAPFLGFNTTAAHASIPKAAHSAQQSQYSGQYQGQYQAGSQQHSSTTADLWWTKLFHATSLHHIMFATGTPMFAYLPLMVCGVAVLAALIPGITAYTRYREDIVAIVLPTMLFMGVCSHVCELCITFVLPREAQTRVIASAFVLHAGMHAMLQCTKTYVKLAARIRQSTSHTVLFLPLCYLGMLGVYFLALGMPAVSWEVARSPQDILVMHAIVAFLPEAVGTVLVMVLRALRGALDASTAL